MVSLSPEVRDNQYKQSHGLYGILRWLRNSGKKLLNV